MAIARHRHRRWLSWRGTFVTMGGQCHGAGVRAAVDPRLDLALHVGLRFFRALVCPLPPGGAARPAWRACASGRAARTGGGGASSARRVTRWSYRMNFGLVIIGDEILSGKRADKHLPKVIELLAARGLSLAWARYVGDEPARITADLQAAFASGDVVFSCGGIGATPDDHTRQCAAAALGVPLALHPEAKEFVLERMREVAREQGTTFAPDRDDN